MLSRLRIAAAVAALLVLTFCPMVASAGEGMHGIVSLTAHWVGYTCFGLFIVAYGLVVLEEFLHLRKSIPVLVAGGLTWILIGVAYTELGDHATAALQVRHTIEEYAELMLFLLVAMTYINTLEERRLFDALRSWLIGRGFSLRTIYWLMGLLAFFISPLADNMTTALVMASVAMAVGRDSPRFVVVSCISIVVAANAGGAWSPFGDITTLMVWQKGVLPAKEFLVLFLPGLINWLVPAAFMSISVPKGRPPVMREAIGVRPGGFVVVGMFIATIGLTVSMHSWLHLPPVLGMMGGLGLLKLYAYTLVHYKAEERVSEQALNIFHQIARVEWDTLLFFYGIILCVGGLGTIGYLALGSQLMYGELGPSTTNIAVGILSAVVDNIPVMYAVLTMNPEMSDGQWLLLTLTTGVGGSLLSVGSAAGVAVMGQARGVYTFFAHLRWTWAIALGYAASIAVHFWINAATFTAS